MKIAAFNMKRLGWSKVSNSAVLDHLIKIVSRYSVVVLLEVVNKDGTAMEWFLDELNAANATEDEVKLTHFYQYEDDQDGDEDAFIREPYILRFSCPATVVQELVLIPVHTKPEDTVKELNELYDVVEDVKEQWGTDNIMILGDFNADGRYLSKRRMKRIRIHSDPNYHWLIDDDVDTTALNDTDYAYDRIVVYGNDMLKAIVPGSAKSFNFQRAYGLTDDMALKISDHYPVEVELKNKGLKRMCVPQAPRQNVPSRPARKKGPQKKNNVNGKQMNEQNVPPKRKRVRSSQASHTPAKRGCFKK